MKGSGGGERGEKERRKRREWRKKVT